MNSDTKEYYVGVTREQLKECLKKFWCMQYPEQFLHPEADSYIESESIVSKEELVECILDSPDFKVFLESLILKFVQGYTVYFDNDDVYRFAKKAIVNMYNYKEGKKQAKDIVIAKKKLEKEKVTKSQIREAKRVLKRAMVRFKTLTS